IGTIRDKGYKLEDLEFIIDNSDGEKVYLRKLLTHSISVEFQGKTYDLTAKVELRRFVGYHPCVVESTLIGSEAYVSGSVVESVMNIHRVYSDGKENTDPIICELGVFLEPNDVDYVEIFGYKNNLTIIESSLKQGDTNYRSTDHEHVVCIRHNDFWNVRYNYFDINIKVIYDEAWYDDGILRCQFPNVEMTNISSAVPEVVFENSGTNEKGNYSVYWLNQRVTANVGELNLEATGIKQIVAYE
ncbi:MAG: hypothetical protein J6K16_06660, partial [Alphaproteobacteria bacterium]|nr:hypothetical protein [Alphaproteobacteria bacterium]